MSFKLFGSCSQQTYDSCLNIPTDIDGRPQTIVSQPDGKIFYGGAFTLYSGTTVNRFVKLNYNGTIDTSFTGGTMFNVGDVRESVTQSDGKVVVVGTFTQYSGNTRNRIVRLNTNGSIDSEFIIGTGFTGNAFRTTIQSDGKILVGGSFSQYSGTSINRILRLNTNGSLDTGFTVGTGLDNYPYRIRIQDDGKIVLVGLFTSYSGNTRNRIVRLNTNGTLDTGFTIGTGFNDIAFSSQLQRDGKIVVVGTFTEYSGNTRNSIVRLNTDGSLDTSFNIGTGFNGIALIVDIQPDGKIIVLGQNFTEYNGTSCANIVRLNTDGSVDTTFNTGTGFNGAVFAGYIQSNGKILVAGDFTQYNGVNANRIVRLNNDGTIDKC